jgi:hypothetical protein
MAAPVVKPIDSGMVVVHRELRVVGSAVTLAVRNRLPA